MTLTTRQDLHAPRHPMFGSVTAWFYKAIAGINFDESSETKQIIISPKLVADLSYCNASYKSIYGFISSSWNIDEGGAINLNAEIPANTTAMIYLLETDNKIITESGSPLNQQKNILLIGKENNNTIVQVGSGSYTFSIKYND